MFNDDDFDIDEGFLQDVIPNYESTASTSNNSESTNKRHSGDKIDIEIGNKKTKTCDKNFNEEAPVNTGTITDTDNNLLAAINSTTDAVKSKTKRKFPGPAGLLPQLDRGSFLEDLTKESEKKDEKAVEDHHLINSQTQSDPISSSVWKEAINVFQMKPANEKCPLGRYTISWVRQRAVTKKLPQHKVPFLLVGLRTLDSSTRDPSVTLQDTSGEMNGIIHHDLWLEQNNLIQPGSVLALRNVGVISTGPYARHQCLNITSNNIISIFTPGNSQDSSSVIRHAVQTVDRDTLIQESESNERDILSLINAESKQNESPSCRNFFSSNITKSINSPITLKNTPKVSTPNMSQLNKSIGGKVKETQSTLLNKFAPKVQNQYITSATSSKNLSSTNIQARTSTNFASPAQTVNKFIPKSQSLGSISDTSKISSMNNLQEETGVISVRPTQNFSVNRFIPKEHSVIAGSSSQSLPIDSNKSTVPLINAPKNPTGQLSSNKQLNLAFTPNRTFVPKTTQPYEKSGLNNLKNLTAPITQPVNKFVPKIQTPSINNRPSNLEKESDLNNLLDGLDTDSLFDDF